MDLAGLPKQRAARVSSPTTDTTRVAEPERSVAIRAGQLAGESADRTGPAQVSPRALSDRVRVVKN